MSKRIFDKKLEIVKRHGSVEEIRDALKMARTSKDDAAELLNILQEKIAKDNNPVFFKGEGCVTVAKIGFIFPELRESAFKTIETTGSYGIFISILELLEDETDSMPAVATMLENANCPASIYTLISWLLKSCEARSENLWDVSQTEPAFFALLRMLPKIENDRLRNHVLGNLSLAAVMHKEFFDLMCDFLIAQMPDYGSETKLLKMVKTRPDAARDVIDALSEKSTPKAYYAIRDIAEALPKNAPYAVEVLTKAGTLESAIMITALADGFLRVDDFTPIAQKTLSGLIELKDVFNSNAILLDKAIQPVLKKALARNVLPKLIEASGENREELKEVLLQSGDLVSGITREAVSEIFDAAVKDVNLAYQKKLADEHYDALYEKAVTATLPAPEVI